MLCLANLWRVIDTSARNSIWKSNILSIQVLHSFWFTANELQTRSLFLGPIENTHTLYSKMAAALLAMPTVTPTARGLLEEGVHCSIGGVYFNWRRGCI